jgi:two-component system chemotaxis sensor kinase CheA
LEIYPSPGLDLSALLEQLGRFGHLSVAQEGRAEREEPWVLVFTSDLPADEVAETLAFTLAPDRFRVLGGEVEEEDGFGLFTEPPRPQPAVVPAWLEEDGFGLFEPLPNVVASGGLAARVPVAYEEDGFGLFELPPAFEAARQPVAAESMPEAPEPAVRSERSAAPVDSSIRVSTEKVDTLLNLVGELVITQSMLMQSASELDPAVHERLLNGVAQLERNSRELQEAVMSIRMTPISFVFSRFPRVVRDLAAKLNKQVELKMVGDNTELDKGFIEKLSDPLTHLVRNSLDHGIEAPALRQALGKSAAGRITLRASHQGSSIVIEVNDDGAGLSRGRILAKARERGVTISEAASDAEVWNLIFEPGFSTAAGVTDVSGRGVGMDVVRKNIHALGGRIEVDSLPDYGTTIRIRLPLTLAILDGMSVRVGGETYIFPLGFVLESLQPCAKDVYSVGGKGRVLSVRGEYVPIMALADFFNIDSAKRNAAEGILIIVEAEGARAALLVDDLLGQQQFVVKNLETNYRKVIGVSGATIMGDGQVALILDVSALVRVGQRQPWLNQTKAGIWQ